jgi:hypothetical protein
MTPRKHAFGLWSRLARRTPGEPGEQAASAQPARDAIRHGRRCHAQGISHCPGFNSGITARMAGQLLSPSSRRFHAVTDSFYPVPYAKCENIRRLTIEATIQL